MDGPVEANRAVDEQDRAVAQPLDGRGVVGDEQDRPAAFLEGCDDAEALSLEALVPDGEHLVEQQDVGLEECGDGEAETHRHA